MTRVSSVYDGFISLIEVTLPGYRRLPNAYELDMNPAVLLTKGYAVAFGAAINTERLVGPKVSIERSFNIVLVNQITTTELNQSQRASIEKALMEDVFSLIKAVESDVTLCGASDKTGYDSDGGVEYLASDRIKYFITQIQFNSEYIESLS